MCYRFTITPNLKSHDYYFEGFEWDVDIDCNDGTELGVDNLAKQLIEDYQKTTLGYKTSTQIFGTSRLTWNTKINLMSFVEKNTFI